MSEANRVDVAYIEEVTFGTTPASALTSMRKTGESLAFNVANISSQEIRADRQIPDLIQTGAESGGGVDFEMSYAAFDDLFEGALWNSWGSALTITDTDISTTGGGGTSTFDAVGADFPAFVAGQWIKSSGFTNSANNGFFQILSATSSTITLVADDLVTEAAGNSVTIKGQMLRNGTERHSYTLEKVFQDLATPQYLWTKGNVINTMSLSVAANEIMTGSFNFIGTAGGRATATQGSGAYTAAPSNDVMNAVSNVGDVKENDAPLGAGIFVQGVSMELNNNVRGRAAIGTLGFVDVKGGSIAVEGSMQIYFHENAATIYDRYVNGTESAFSFSVTDGAGNSYVFSMPRIKFSTAQVLAGGLNQDVLMDMSFTAIRDATFDATFQIDRFAA